MTRRPFNISTGSTISSAPGYIAMGHTSTLFDSASTSVFSRPFAAPEGEVLVIRACLPPGTTLSVENGRIPAGQMPTGSACGGVVCAPYDASLTDVCPLTVCCTAQTMSSCGNMVLLPPLPGFMRLVLAPAPQVGLVNVYAESITLAQAALFPDRYWLGGCPVPPPLVLLDCAGDLIENYASVPLCSQLPVVAAGFGVNIAVATDLSGRTTYTASTPEIGSLALGIAGEITLGVPGSVGNGAPPKRFMPQVLVQDGLDSPLKHRKLRADTYISVFDAPFNAVGGFIADDSDAIQAAIDFAIYTAGSAGGKVKVILGTQHRITKPIHMGYGVSFTSVIVEGAGYAYAGGAAFCGTTIIADFWLGVAFNMQGARGSILRGVAVIGKLLPWITNNQLGNAAPTLDDTVLANWFDPSMPPASYSRYAPYAAVALDAYSGVRPGVSYPDVVYPPSLGVVPQYGKLPGSDCMVEDCYFSGFVVPVVNQPCDADSNGDFLALKRVTGAYNAYGLVSVGNTQSRNVAITDCKIALYHTGLTTKAHGRRSGKLGGVVSDLSAGAGINLLDVTGVFGGPLTFLNLYCEAQWRLGTITAGSSNENSVIFQNCLFSFLQTTAVRGVPATHLDGGGTPIDIKFIGGFIQTQSVFVANQTGNVVFDGTVMSPALRNGIAAPNAYTALAHNHLAGGVVLPLLQQPALSTIKFSLYNVDTLAVADTVFCHDNYKFSSRQYCLPYHVKKAAALNTNYADEVLTPRVRAPYAKSGLTISLVNKTLTVDFVGSDLDNLDVVGPSPGDVLLDATTMMTFFVRSRVGTVVIAEAQNNYKPNGVNFDTIVPFSTTAGTFYVGNSRFYVPPYFMKGTLTTASPVLTGCGRSDGFAAWIPAAIVVDDRLYVNQETDFVFDRRFTKVVTTDGVGNVTLASNALTTSTRRLPLWIRKPPANV